ncbi:hypothetical protein FS837_009354 [Tulasnella sp. UAMH 9824]|nr:hypothetical protein FS837_009354 [Tulasnella sp. UAMH 9824]
MSRAPPFPTSSSRSRAASNANVNGNGYYTNEQSQYQYPNGLSQGSTAPLRIPPGSDASSSTGSGFRSVSQSNGSAPVRPMRSEMRGTRNVSQASSQASTPRGEYREQDRGLASNRSTGTNGRERVQYESGSSGSTLRPRLYEAVNRTNGGGYASEAGPSRPSMESLTYDDDAAYGGYDEEVPAANEPRIEITQEVSPAVNNVIDVWQKAAVKTKGSSPDVQGRGDQRAEERKKEVERFQRIQARQNSRMMPVRKTRPGEIDSVLDEIGEEWEFVAESEFNPVSLALSLLDNSPAGRDPNSFRRAKDMLANSLRGTIDQNYQEFAAALPHHASLLNSLNKVQSEIGDTRSRLQETRDTLANKRTDLVQLWSRGQAVEEMLRLLDEIEHLKGIPDTLESMMSEKRLLQAAILLVRSLRMINKGELMEIGALADLRSYLSGQETALREILIDELQNHLYLKVFWCDSRWASYVPGQQQLPVTDAEDDPMASLKQPLSEPPRPIKLTRFLNNLALRPSNENPYDLAEESDLSKISPSASTQLPSSTSAGGLLSKRQSGSASQNPESNSFEYIETLLEALAVLGKLGGALDSVAQRLPIELFSLVETTIEEIRDRSDLGKRASMNLQSVNRSSRLWITSDGLASLKEAANSLRLAALEAHTGRMDREPLKDLFWTLYSKLDAVLQGLRVVYEVANRIGSRRDFKDSSGGKPGALFPLMDIWAPIQTEVRTLLGDYLTDEERGAISGRHQIASINEVLREGRVQRDKSKAVFRAGKTDAKTSAKTLKRHEDELTRVLKESVPGLVGGSADTTIQASQSTGTGTDDRYTGAGSHFRIIKADAFHVTVLFQPTLAFLQRVEQVLPPGMGDVARASTAFLDEFVVKVYLPQLEDKVATLFHQAAVSADAFQEDPLSMRLSPKPLIKASTQLVSLINSLCAMHRSTPFHTENYSRLILDIIIRFYQRCYDRFVDLVTVSSKSSEGPEANLAMSARWGQKPEVTACLSGLFACKPSDEASMKRLCRQETRVELNFLTKETVTRADLIPATKNITALGTLYHSLTWLISQLQTLKGDAVEAVISPVDNILSPISEQLMSPTSFAPPVWDLSGKLQLPLTKAMALRYDALLKTYEQLAELVIHTIRIEIRCRIIHFLDLAMRQGNYQLDHEPGEPDPHVIDLNSDLAACEDCTTLSLPEREKRFIFEGLGTLMEHLLISNARHVRFANDLGIKKIFRNILALQQNLKLLSDLPEDAEFGRARRYWELFLLTPQQLLEGVKKKPQFSFDDYKSMLYLRCGVDQTLGDRGVTDNAVNMYLIELHGLVVDDWDDTAE